MLLALPLTLSALAAFVGDASPARHVLGRPQYASRRPPLYMRKKKESWARGLPAQTPLSPGSTIIAAEGSFDHYFMDSLVLLIEHSEETGYAHAQLDRKHADATMPHP